MPQTEGLATVAAAQLRALRYHRSGRGASLLLVGPFWPVWEPVLPALTRTRDVIAVDLPGFGAAAGAPAAEQLTVGRMADAVGAVLTALELDVVDVAGVSLGASVAAELAKRGHARSLTLFAPLGLGSNRERRRTLRRLTLVRGSSRLAGPLVPFGARTVVGRVMFAGAGMHLARPWRHEREAMIITTREYLRAPGFEAAFRSVLSGTPEGLERIRCPTVIVWGSRDLIVSPRQAERWRERVRGASVRVLRGAGHVAMSDDPQGATSVILENAVRAA